MHNSKFQVTFSNVLLVLQYSSTPSPSLEEADAS